MVEKKEYIEHYVAFIDILGFKELLYGSSSCEDIYSVFEHLLDNSQTSLFYNGEDVEAFNHVKHYIMSDSIVLYIRTDIEEAFLALIGTCLSLQSSLLYREKPILVRGGIAKGPLFVDDRIIFGKGLSDAYQIENGVSIYPRIVFNKELLRYVKLNNQSAKRQHWDGMMLRKDDDELLFVHYLAYIFVKGIEETPKKFDHILSFCQSYLDKTYSRSLREKFMWLKRYLISECELQNELLKELPYGTDFLRKWNIRFNVDKTQKNN